MKINKAFTLIELLAVIIILAIVALIATPIILNVIEDARKSAGLSESNMILSGINNYCVSEDMKYQLDNSYKKICTTSMNAENVKTMVNLGNATIDKIIYNGSKLIELVITSNNHKFKLCPNGTFVMDDEECQRDPNSLITKLLKQYQEGNQTGLIKNETNENLYYYTGTNEEVANNFLWYGGHQWRVLEFDVSANTLTLITQQPLTAIQPASAIWASEEEYNESYINNWLNDYFWNTLDSSIQENILNNIYSIGIHTDVDSITTTQKVGLLNVEQYKRANSTDSFLDIKDYWWLTNYDNDSNLYRVSSDGTLSSDKPIGTIGIRPVIKIFDLTIAEGNDGTLTDNYQVSNKTTNINSVQVGEYINVPYNGNDGACGNDNKCLFRVVNKDNDSVKVILNGLLPNDSQYGSSTIITTAHAIYTPLTTFASNISMDYRYVENKVFYIGDYPNSSTNYNNIKKETLLANVGLPTVGEIFSGNDIDMTYPADGTKTFVDVDTIENPTALSTYWTMNRMDSIYIRFVANNGDLHIHDINIKDGIRPVIFLKNNLNFVSGNGTAQSPYELSS